MRRPQLEQWTSQEKLPTHLHPRELGGHGLSHWGILKGLPSFLFALKAGAKAEGSSTIPNTLGLSLIIISQQLLSLILQRQLWGGPTWVERCGNDLQAWYRGL